MPDELDKRRVFVIHGRNSKINQAMFDFLRALDLNPLEWSELVAQTGEGSPHVSTVIQQGIRNVGAVVALLTPDDLAFLHPILWTDKDKDHEKQPSPQGRPNVLFEMGMAFALQEDQTIIVQVGELRPFSDIAGRHVIPFDGSPDARNDLKTRLRTAGCPVKDAGEHWLKVGDFTLQSAREFKLNLENSTIGDAEVSSTSTGGSVDLETKRQLVYARAIEIVTQTYNLPEYLKQVESSRWFTAREQIVRLQVEGTGLFSFPRAEAIVEPSMFKSVDRGKMKAAAKIVALYLFASDHDPEFRTVRERFDLPDPNQLRKEYHDAQLSLIL